MFRPHKITLEARVSYWQMTYIEMIKLIKPIQRFGFDQAFRSELYEYVPMTRDKKIIDSLIERFPTLEKLLPKRRQVYVKSISKKG